MVGSFKYRPASPEFVKKQSMRRGRTFDGIFQDEFPVVSLKPGDNRIRFLPATWDKFDDFTYTVWVHRIFGDGGGSWLCLDRMKGERCPLCEESRIARKGGDDEQAKKLSPTEMKVAWCLERGSEEPFQPKLILLPFSLYKDLCRTIYDSEDHTALKIDNPDGGYDIRINKTGEKLMTRYLPIVSPNESPLAKDQTRIKKIMDFVEKNPVPDTLDYKTEDYLDKVVSGTSVYKDKELDSDDDVDTDEPKTNGHRPKVKAKEVDPWEDDDDQEEAPRRKLLPRNKREIEEEDEAPRRKLKARVGDDDDEDEDAPPSRKKRVVEDDDDEDYVPTPKKRRSVTVDDDEDEDEPPRRSRR